MILIFLTYFSMTVFSLNLENRSILQNIRIAHRTEAKILTMTLGLSMLYEGRIPARFVSETYPV